MNRKTPQSGETKSFPPLPLFRNTPPMQAHFLLGPAGSGKTRRCLGEIREELLARPDGPPLILLAPKQATFQLERQLLADPALAGYTRLRILSFERLARFVLKELHIAPPEMLNEQGRVMVLRALLFQHEPKLKIFRASARLTGFAQQLSLLLREFQHHRLSHKKLFTLADESDAPASLRDKLHDLALLIEAYDDWLKARALQDANSLLDVATSALRNPQSTISIARVWLDGFAEMTPQEMELLAALLPFCQGATLAFCLHQKPESDPSWLSTWSVVGQTFRRCGARINAIEGCSSTFETLSNKPGCGRFGENDLLRHLEANWSNPASDNDPNLLPSHFSLRASVCPDPEAEAVLAAREILGHVRNGGRYRDCAVIVRSLEPYHATVDRVFRRYEIPFFMDRRKPMSHHPLAELTRFVLRTVAYGWRHDDWFGALKSGLVRVSEGALDELENAALAFGWEGKTWRNPLPPETPHAARLEQIRAHVMPPFEKFAAAVAKESPTGRQLAAALEQFWRELEIESQIEEWSDAAPENSATRNPQSAFHQSVLEQMRDWLENLARAFPDGRMTLREWLPILEAGLSGLTVGVIPPALDQVLIGAVDRSRNPDLKLVLVLGMNEGVFPAPPVPGTLLTETDRASLERVDVYLGPTSRQQLGHERYLGYIACTRASERLVLTCAAEDGKGKTLNPSPFLANVSRITGVKEEKFSTAADWWRSEHACELVAPLLRLKDADPELTRLPALQPVVARWRNIQESSGAKNLPAGVVGLLFGNEIKSSVSALEDFAACPFRFFAARTLRLEERKEFQVDARDRGNFHHEVLEQFHRAVTANGGKWRDLDVDAAVKLVGRIAREHLPASGHGRFQSGGAAQFAGKILIERIEKLVAALIGWLPQYEFDPVESEIAFEDGKPGALPSWRLDLGNGRALLLRGRIDRVDVLRLPDETALGVVMDYKSGVRRLDNTKLHHGLELQLLSYLGVLKHLGDLEKFPGSKRLTPAGVFYIPLNGGAGKPGGKRNEVAGINPAENRDGYRHSGRFLAEKLARFDSRGVNKGDQFTFKVNKDGKLSASASETLPREEFDHLRVKVEEHLRDYARKIFAGGVEVSPFCIGKKTACDYCDFRPVCRFDPWTQQYRSFSAPPKKPGSDKDE